MIFGPLNQIAKTLSDPDGTNQKLEKCFPNQWNTVNECSPNTTYDSCQRPSAHPVPIRRSTSVLTTRVCYCYCLHRFIRNDLK